MTAVSRFPSFARGELRDLILSGWRADLRAYTNPETNAPFTEREIATATSPGSRWYAEADAVDLALMQGQRRSVWLAMQAHERTASSLWLKNYHGPRRGLSVLPPTGGTGVGQATGNSGITYAGSTTLGASTAARAQDDDGRVYQVLVTASIPAGQFTVPLTFRAIDTGEETNLVAGDTLTWIENAPAGTRPTVEVLQDFRGGHPRESMAEYAQRIEDDRRHRAGSGNWSHMRSWAREASTAVQDAFIYPVAKYAGTCIVCVLQKRGKAVGPDGRLASVGTLTDVTAAVVPPGSPDVPGHALVLVVRHVSEPSNMVLTLSLPHANPAGWADIDPWPHQANGVAATVGPGFTDQQNFQIEIPFGSPLPTTSAPSMMFWHKGTSQYILLAVSSVTHSGGQIYDVALSAEPSQPIAAGDYVCPNTERRDFLNESIGAYFDSLGPGELITLTSDPRKHRAFRHPVPSEQWPSEAGSAIVDWIREAMGSAMVNGALQSISVSVPSRPSDPVEGPSLIVPGNIGVYPT